MKIITMLLVLFMASFANGADAKGKKETAYIGKVVDSEGRPVAGATIEAYQYPAGSSALEADWQLVHQTASKPDGQFELPTLSAQTIIIARKQGLSIDWDSVMPQSLPQQDQAPIRLIAPLSVSGQVVDESGQPISGAEVYVALAFSEKMLDASRKRFGLLSGVLGRKFFSVRTGADGKFRLAGFPGNAAVDLDVAYPGKVPKMTSRTSLSPETMQCRAGEDNLKVILESGCMIEGKVIAKETGEPISKARIAAQKTGASYYRGITSVSSDASGNFRFPSLPSGTYNLRASFSTNMPEGYLTDSVSLTVQAGETRNGVQIEAVRAGYLAVSVRDGSTQKMAEKVRVTASKATFSAAALTDQSGRVLLRMVPGDYTVTAYQQDSPSKTGEASIQAGLTNQMEFKVVPPPMITITVRTPSGAPATGIPVVIMPTYYFTSQGPMVTDSKGQYQFRKQARSSSGLSGVTPSVVARDTERKLAASAQLSEDDTKIELRLSPALTVVGRIEDEKRKPVTNSFVNVTFWTGNMGMSLDQKPAQTDAQGRFEIGCLPHDHKYTVNANAPGYGSASQTLQADETQSKRVELKPFVLKLADKEISGLVMDDNDKPMSSVNVNSYGENQPNQSVRTDEQGRFKFKVCEGMVRISASTTGSKYGNTTAEAGETNVILTLSDQSSSRVRPQIVRPSLKGKAVPDLATVNLDKTAIPADKPGLLCLFDCEQRPSRRTVRLLAEQTDALKKKGLSVAAIQAAVTAADTLKTWQDSASVPFAVGRIAEKNEKTKWAADVQSLPWLILFDKSGKVIDEGFALDELEAKLSKLEK